MGSAKKMFTKLAGMKIGGVQPIKPVEQVQEEKQVVERTEAQQGAAAARRRRNRRMGGQRSLLYATRLTGAPEDETRQSTLG